MKVGEGEGEEAPGRIIYQLGEIFSRVSGGGKRDQGSPPLKNGRVRVLVTPDGSEMLCSTCTRLPPLTLGTLRVRVGEEGGERMGTCPKKINRAGILLGCEAERKIAIEG